MLNTKKIDNFVNFYPLSKTLQFSLIPIGKTLENFHNNQMLVQDEERAEHYKKMKGFMDRCHKSFIESLLSEAILSGLDDYAELYYQHEKSKEDKKAMLNLEDDLRHQISQMFHQHEGFDSMFKKEMITQILPDFLENADEKEIYEEFVSFSTYFTNFFQIRRFLYTSEEKHGSVAYRCINENLPKFLDNVKIFKSIIEYLPKENIEDVNDAFSLINGIRAEDIFTVNYFSFVLSQSGIDAYNQFIGGYTLSDGTKQKGLNEYINQYNQKAKKNEKLPKLQSLFKQILSEKTSFSFIPEKFKTDDEVLTAINSFYNEADDERKSFAEILDTILAISSALPSYDISGMYIRGETVSSLSNSIFSSWNAIQTAWNNNYDFQKKKKPKNIEKYEKTRQSAYKKINSFSIEELQKLCDSVETDEPVNCSIIDYYKNAIENSVSVIREKYDAAQLLITKGYAGSKKLKTDDVAIALLKDLLDSIKALESLLKPLCGTGSEAEKDYVFYGDFTPACENIRSIDKLYDMVRNYVTQKPYSKDKIKLNFDTLSFLGGWEKNKESTYHCALLVKDGLYYLAVTDKDNGNLFLDAYCDKNDNYQKIEYKQLPGPNKMLPKVFFANSNIEFFSPSPEIMKIYNSGSFKKGPDFNIDDCHKLIDFYKESIGKHKDWSNFNFVFKPTSEYNNIGEFYDDVRTQGYKISYQNVAQSFIDEKINTGALYLFQIYNKDFSPSSKGIPNLHTLYFKMLFDERNLNNVVYKLNGDAEMFYRKPSIAENERIIHPANQPVENKNPLTEKSHSLFTYDLIKNKRFTEPQFSLHVPITLNFKANGKSYINDKVRAAIKSSKSNYVIGIDRGERNLIYVCVIDDNGNIVEQFSFNEIVNDYNGVKYKADYHSLLDEREKERKAARQDWNSIESIKELKNGYISQVVHKICELMLKYDAVIAMEDLNSGFKNSRAKVEKQVYQKFENMLIAKLNYLADKKTDPLSCGGLLNAYQLTNSTDDFKHVKFQNGFVFYVPAWLTSKMDPTTGFVDLLHPHYDKIETAKEFISHFICVAYNNDTQMFEFSFDYADFPKGCTDYIGKWTVCSNGTRVKTFRNPAKNSQWDSEEVNITDEFIKFFEKYDIAYRDGNLKNALLSSTSKDFYHDFLSLMSLMLQMRNSVTGTDVDYLLSPVRNSNGDFYDSRNYDDSSKLPANADANGAYNIARKLQWALKRLETAPDEELNSMNISITNREWLKYAQEDR